MMMINIKQTSVLSLFELAAWLRIPGRTIVALTKNPDEPLPVFDEQTLKFFRPDVLAWIERWGMAAPNDN